MKKKLKIFKLILSNNIFVTLCGSVYRKQEASFDLSY